MCSVLRRGASVLCATLALAACSDPSGPSGPASIRIDLRQPSLTALGDSVALTAAVLDQRGDPVAGAGISWSTSSAEVATVSPQGVVVARSVGSARITARADNLSDTTTVTVAQVPGGVELTVRQPTLTSLGDSLALAATVYDRNRNPIPNAIVEWESAAADRVRITAQGIVIAAANGQAIVTARAGSVSDTTTVTVAQRAARLVFLTRPEAQLARRILDPSIEVALEDARGSRVMIPTGSVALSLLPSGTLAGTASVSPVDGVATFADIRILDPGRGYRLRAQVDGAPDAASVFFDVHIALADVSAGHVHTCGLDAVGIAYCWGDNAAGRVGDGTTTNRTVPTRIGGDRRFTAIDAGAPGSWALDGAGLAFRWGSGALTPTPLQGAPAFALLETRWYTCGITPASLAYCWGVATDAFGAGPSNGGASASAPTLAMGGRTLNAIATSLYSTCGIATDGAAWCAGQNFYGELGNGSTVFSSTPTPVAGGLRFTSLEMGNSFACGIATDGQTYCWGRNDHRQLGDPEAGAQSVFPVVVAGPQRFTRVSLGADHACGLTAEGAAYCWGRGGSGNLGTGEHETVRATPTAVAGNLRFRAISAGSFHTCGISREGYTYCWGFDSSGQLGRGSDGGFTLAPTLIAPPPL